MQQMTQSLHLDWHDFKVLLILRKPDWYYSDLWIRSGCCVDVYLRLFGNQMTSSFLAVIVSVVPSLLLSYVETTLTFVCPSCRSTVASFDITVSDVLQRRHWHKSVSDSFINVLVYIFAERICIYPCVNPTIHLVPNRLSSSWWK